MTKSPSTWLKLVDVTQLTGCGRSTIYRWIQQGFFPKQHKYGVVKYHSRWDRQEVIAWMERHNDTQPPFDKD